MEDTHKQVIYSGLFHADWEVIGNIDHLISDVKRGAEGVERTIRELLAMKECPKKQFLRDNLPRMEAEVKKNYSNLIIWTSMLKPVIELPDISFYNGEYRGI